MQEARVRFSTMGEAPAPWREAAQVGPQSSVVAGCQGYLGPPRADTGSLGLPKILAFEPKSQPGGKGPPSRLASLGEALTTTHLRRCARWGGGSQRRTAGSGSVSTSVSSPASGPPAPRRRLGPPACLWEGAVGKQKAKNLYTTLCVFCPPHSVIAR